MLETQGESAGSWPEPGDDRYLYHVCVGLRCEDALNPGSAVGAEQRDQAADVRLGSVGDPRHDLPERASARKGLHDGLGELPGPDGDGARGS